MTVLVDNGIAYAAFFESDDSDNTTTPVVVGVDGPVKKKKRKRAQSMFPHVLSCPCARKEDVVTGAPWCQARGLMV